MDGLSLAFQAVLRLFDAVYNVPCLFSLKVFSFQQSACFPSNDIFNNRQRVVIIFGFRHGGSRLLLSGTDAPMPSVSLDM